MNIRTAAMALAMATTANDGVVGQLLTASKLSPPECLSAPSLPDEACSPPVADGQRGTEPDGFGPNHWVDLAAVSSWRFDQADKQYKRVDLYSQPASKRQAATIVDTGSAHTDDPLGLTKQEVSGIDGIADMLEAYTYATKKVRLKYMADEIEIRRLSHPDQVQERIPSDRYEFKIGIDYNMMVLFGTGEPLDMKFDKKGDVIRIDFIPVERNDDSRVVRELGPPGAYIFEYRAGRWTLTQELR